MLNFSARAFFWCGRALRGVKSDCVVASAVCLDGTHPGFAMAQDLDERAREKAKDALNGVEAEFRKLGMTITADTAKEVADEMEDGNRRNFQWLHTRIESIEGIAEKEFHGRAFFYIPPQRMKFWPKADTPYAFGKHVADVFPSTVTDSNYAGLCLATSLSTAAVFHLMRVLEIGLTVLGKQFGVSLAHTNWAPAIEQIESKIRGMRNDPAWKALPDCKEQQEYYSQAASHFAILKDAWRNYTMHVRGNYTQDQAELLFENVKAFTRQLSERLGVELMFDLRDRRNPSDNANCFIFGAYP